MVEQIDKNTDDGAVLGKNSSSKIAFFGGTPVDKPAKVTDEGASADPGEVRDMVRNIGMRLNEMGLIDFST